MIAELTIHLDLTDPNINNYDTDPDLYDPDFMTSEDFEYIEDENDDGYDEFEESYDDWFTEEG